jgi:hypothetical protein
MERIMFCNCLNGKCKIKYKLLMVLATILLLCTGYAGATWQALDAPGAGATFIRDIDGSNLVGQSNLGGFLFDGTSWTAVNKPGTFTQIFGISGNNIVGSYRNTYNGPDHGFLYDGTSWTTLDAPGASQTIIYGIDGSNVVGRYLDGSSHGFLYDGTSWTFFDAPGASQTIMYGIDGSNIVGKYSDGSGWHNFLYDGISWTVLDVAGTIRDIDGSNLVGYDSEDETHGLFFNGTSWTTLSPSGASQTLIYGIDGNNLVGGYSDASHEMHGFIYTIPEPATLLLLSFGAVILRRKCS